MSECYTGHCHGNCDFLVPAVCLSFNHIIQCIVNVPLSMFGRAAVPVFRVVGSLDKCLSEIQEIWFATQLSGHVLKGRSPLRVRFSRVEAKKKKKS